jgi:hypothetical protein
MVSALMAGMTAPLADRTCMVVHAKDTCACNIPGWLAPPATSAATTWRSRCDRA